MEQIQERAREGLLAAPRVGMGIGGLLLGVRRDGRILLLDSIDISCSHSNGLSFNLTADELQESRDMIAEARSLAVPGGPVVIGWYCSKTRGDASLNEADLAFYNELFPERWQIALVVRPNPAEPLQAAFFFRNENGIPVKGLECRIDDWQAFPGIDARAESGLAENAPQAALAARANSRTQTPAAAPVPAPAELAPMQAPPPREMLGHAETSLADIIELSESGEAAGLEPPTMAYDPGFFEVSELEPVGPVRSGFRFGKLAWIAGVVATLALGTAAFLTQDSWMPRPALVLSSIESDGNLMIHWNADALHGISKATMFLNDGVGGLQTVPLDAFQLNSGLLSYPLHSKRVTAKLTAGDVNAITVWFAPDPPAAVPVAPAPATAANPTAPPGAKPSPVAPAKQ
jgi:proteasome lid subunit RPN8/RPN11